MKVNDECKTQGATRKRMLYTLPCFIHIFKLSAACCSYFYIKLFGPYNTLLNTVQVYTTHTKPTQVK
jgi:hypothetical protein